MSEYCKNCERLKAELHFKVEYIHEQRDIIDQCKKEIEMYKKCQGKRASKREEELGSELQAEQEKVKKLENKLKQCWDFHNKFIERADNYKQAKIVRTKCKL